MKKLFALMLAALMMLGVCSALAEAAHTDEEVLNMAQEELKLARDVAFYPHAFEGDFDQFYVDFHKLSRKLRKPGITAEDYDQVVELTRKREALTQIVDDPKSTVWDIWEGNMASEPKPTEGWEVAYDNPDFFPNLCPYLIEDQENVKGNVIVIGGGANTHRNNVVEGYPVAEFFNDNGYNAFVLQRRVLPYADVDAVLDLGRAIRYIRHYADEKGIGNADTIITCGFSAGGMNIMETLGRQYGHVTPDTIYPEYVCDEVDQESADMSVAIPIYGCVDTGYDLNANPNLPPIFTALGQNDEFFKESAGESLTWLLTLDTDVCYFLAPDSVHGVGLGTGTENYVNGYTVMADWTDLALDFLDTRLGYLPKEIDINAVANPM